jgi:hypothetical protein
VPGAVGVKSLEVATPLASTGLVDENTSLVQARSLNSRNVTVPDGIPAPARLAMSRTAVPTGPPGEGSARMMTDRRATEMVKVWQAVGATPLLAQTVVGPNVPAWLGDPARMPFVPRVRPGGSDPLVTE